MHIGSPSLPLMRKVWKPVLGGYKAGTSSAFLIHGAPHDHSFPHEDVAKGVTMEGR